jgi:hypothetical protein
MMDCKTAQHVWNHAGGFIAGINCQFKGLVDHLTASAIAFRDKVPDPFDKAVKAKAGNGNYRVTHSDGVSLMALNVHDILGDKVANKIISQTIGKIIGVKDLTFANICCNGCNVSDGSLLPEQELAIQMAAVNTNPDGTSIL